MLRPRRPISHVAILGAAGHFRVTPTLIYLGHVPPGAPEKRKDVRRSRRGRRPSRGTRTRPRCATTAAVHRRRPAPHLRLQHHLQDAFENELHRGQYFLYGFQLKAAIPLRPLALPQHGGLLHLTAHGEDHLHPLFMLAVAQMTLAPQRAGDLPPGLEEAETGDDQPSARTPLVRGRGPQSQWGEPPPPAPSSARCSHHRVSRPYAPSASSLGQASAQATPSRPPAALPGTPALAPRHPRRRRQPGLRAPARVCQP